MTILNDTARLALLREVYASVQEAVESFEHDDMVGPDLAYLLGAVLHERYCEWPAERRIVQLLRDRFAPDHAVWNYLHIEQEDE